MKAFLALIFIAGISAQAVSMKRYDNWSCTFKDKFHQGPVEGTQVEIKFDIFENKGLVTQYPICRLCMINPMVFGVDRKYDMGSLEFKNDNEKFKLMITIAPGPHPGKNEFPAVLNARKPGTCTIK